MAPGVTRSRVGLAWRVHARANEIEAPMTELETEHAPRSRRAWVVVAWVVGGILVLVLGSAFLPRWWSHRIADQVDGNMAQGIGVGLFYGFVFTLLPILLLWWGLRRASRWKTRLILFCIALLLALPNLLTLGIVLGRGDAAHAGERTFDVEAPGFRASVLIGALTAVAAVLALAALLRSRRRAQERADDLHAQLEARPPSAHP